MRVSHDGGCWSRKRQRRRSPVTRAAGRDGTVTGFLGTARPSPPQALPSGGQVRPGSCSDAGSARPGAVPARRDKARPGAVAAGRPAGKAVPAAASPSWCPRGDGRGPRSPAVAVPLCPFSRPPRRPSLPGPVLCGVNRLRGKTRRGPPGGGGGWGCPAPGTAAPAPLPCVSGEAAGLPASSGGEAGSSVTGPPPGKLGRGGQALGFERGRALRLCVSVGERPGPAPVTSRRGKRVRAVDGGCGRGEGTGSERKAAPGVWH